MSYVQRGKETIDIEIEGLQAVKNALDAQFDEVVRAVLNCKGKLVVTGMGKSGLVGKKIAATLASTGTPSFFMHPGEALHGDLGMISNEDAVLLISYSGETEELLRLLAALEKQGNVTCSISGYPDSTLAQNTQFHLNGYVPKEACPLKLAPTASTTAALALGDALAMALMYARNFKAEDFAKFHPGGSLGRKLLVKVKDVMRRDDLPFVKEDISNTDLLIKMSEGKLGLAIIGTAENVKGVITDGDLRRGIIKHGSFQNMSVRETMTLNPKTVKENQKLVEVEQMMKNEKITTILIENEHGSVTGVFQLF